jgi:hypothetical protein
MRPLALAGLLCLALAPAATAAAAATPRPDAHDRAVAAQLGAKVETFQRLANGASGDDDLGRRLRNCPKIKQDPSAAFGAVFALLPVLVIELVNRFKPQLQDLQRTLGRIRPHADVFERWRRADAANLATILRFDNGGKQIDLCHAVTVLLDEKATAQMYRDLLGIDPALVASLLQGTPAQKQLKTLNPRMRAFFVAAGLSPKTAKALTS